MGDFVIARKDTPTSYHLSVTVDDHLQGVTLVTRGVDVLPSTHVHGLLQSLLGYATPQYAHHRLLTDASGRRFAKRDRDMTIRAMRESGRTPRGSHRRVALGGGSGRGLRFAPWNDKKNWPSGGGCSATSTAARPTWPARCSATASSAYSCRDAREPGARPAVPRPADLHGPRRRGWPSPATTSPRTWPACRC